MILPTGVVVIRVTPVISVCLPADPNIKREVTPEKLHAFFGDMVKGEITRYDLPSLNGFNFVLRHALGGGATMSLRLDSLGKSMGSAIMRLKIHVNEGEIRDEDIKTEK